jgi:hypothetical protein
MMVLPMVPEPTTLALFGLDPFFLHSELSVAGMALIDECRTDLVQCEEADEVAPY